MNYLEIDQITAFQNAINTYWNDTKLGILNTCSEVNKAKKELSKQSYAELNVPFTRQTQNRLAAIGNYELIYKYQASVPASWGALYALTRLEPSLFIALIDSGEINEKTTRNQAESFLKSKEINKKKNSKKQLVATIYLKEGQTMDEALEALSESGLLDNNTFDVDTDNAEKIVNRQHLIEDKKARENAAKECHHYLKSKYKTIKTKYKKKTTQLKHDYPELCEYLNSFTLAAIMKEPEYESRLDYVLNYVGADFTFQDKYVSNITC